MSSPDAEKYLDALTPPILEVVDGIRGIEAVDDFAYFGFHDIKDRAMDAARQIDWAGTGIEERTVEMGTRTMVVDPGKNGAKIVKIAFEDTYSLIFLCERRAKELALPLDESFTGLLRRSKGLLAISEMDDLAKRFLLIELTAKTVNFLGKPLDIQPIFLEEDEQARPYFGFHPIVSDRIVQGSGKNTGCPANKKIIETKDGRKRILTRHFWDKMVEAMYGYEEDDTTVTPDLDLNTI